MVPRASRIAVLVNPERQSAANQLEEVHKAAHALGLTLHVQNATSERDFDAAFASFVEQRTDALTVLSDPFFFTRRERLVALAARYALPAIYEWSEFADDVDARGGVSHRRGRVAVAQGRVRG